MTEIKDIEFKDVELTKAELEDYFAMNVQTSKIRSYETTWYTYYLNPSLGLSVKLGEDSMISYSGQQINKIMIVESKNGRYKKTIYFYSEKDNLWLEDIDICTDLSWNDIKFVFDPDDLNISATKDSEKQAYIDLYEKLDPWNDTEQTRTDVKEWFENNKSYIE